MDDKGIAKNIGISMIMKPISLVLSLAYTTMALSFLGQEKYGIWVIILNIVSWINYFDIGIGNGLRNKLAEAYAKEDYKGAQTYVSTACLGTSIISLCFCVIITLVWNLLDLSRFFKLNTLGEDTNVVIFISVFFVCVNFVLALSRTSAYAIQQPGLTSVTGVIGQALQVSILFILSRFLHENLMVVAVMYGLASLFDNVILYFLITRKHKYLKPKISFINMMYMRPLLAMGIGFFVMQICSLVLNTTDNLLISSLYGSSEVTPYDLVYKCFYMFVQVHAIIIMPMWSAYTVANTNNDLKWMKNTMRKINRITLLLSAGVVVGIFLFEPFAAIWLRRRLVYGKDLILIVAIYMIAQMFANNYSSFLCGVGHIKIPTIISIIGAVMNIPLSVFFAQYINMRLAGIILGSFCVMFMSFIVLPIVSYRWLHVREKVGEV